LERLNENPLAIIKDAYRHGRTLSRHLDRLSPSDNGDIDAFSRLMKAADIRVTSDPIAGYWASEGSKFFDEGPAGRVLFSEFFARKWREVRWQTGQQRAIFLSSDDTPGSWQRPYAEAMQPRWDEMITPAIPLSEVIAMTTPITGQDYRSFYLEYSAENLRQFRVGESAEIPITTLTDHENVITLKKYGRGLEATYEQMRRMRVDKLARIIQMMAVQSEIDKLAAAITILINGDGNSNTSATNSNLTTLDPDTVAGTLTLKAWLSWKMKFANPYIITTALMQEAAALDLALLNTGSGNIPLVGYNAGGMVQGLTPINQTSDGVRYGWTTDATANVILGLDRRYALEDVVEIGGEIAEMERFITNQTQVVVMTEVHGFASLDATAVRTLTLNA